MGMTLWRWAAGVTVGCGALAAALVPFPAPVVERWANPTPPPLEREARRLAANVGRTHASVRAYRSAIGLERWRGAARIADTMAVRIDESVPPAARSRVRAIVGEQLMALGSTSAKHAEVFVYVDSSSIDRAEVAEASRRVLERGAPVDIAFALPEATDGARCVSLVRLRGTSPSHIEALRRQSLAGMCGFFAAFGTPGTATREWLSAVDYRVARRSDWHVAMAPVTDASLVYGIGARSGQCLTGKPGACLELIGVGSSARAQRPGTSQLDFVLDGFAPVSAVDRMQPVGELRTVEGELLMSAVREFGAERFRRFWTAPASPDSAFAAATGMTLDDWTRQWMRRTFGELPERPTTRVSHVIWVIASAPLLLLIAARPRERVRDR